MTGDKPTLLEQLSLRDYFAAKAMAAMWANTDVMKTLVAVTGAEQVAMVAYEQADAMLKERAK